MKHDQPCYDRHPGRISLLLGREEAGRKDGDIKSVTKACQEHASPADREAIVREHLTTWDSVSVFSVKEQQHFITYTKENVDELFAEDPDYRAPRGGGLDDPAGDPTPALLPKAKRERRVPAAPEAQPLQQMASDVVAARVPAKAAPAPRPVRVVSPKVPSAGPKPAKRFVAELGADPAVIAATSALKGNVAALFAAFVAAGPDGTTLAWLLTAIGPQLTADGVQNPDNFISAMTSRLKAAGLVKVLTETRSEV